MPFLKMSYLHSKNISLFSKRFGNLIRQQYRNKSGKQRRWTQKSKELSGTNKALEHFDIFYKPVYKDTWPSIRISLLTTNKYCALINNYGDVERARDTLSQLGACDILEEASEALQSTQSPDAEAGEGFNFARETTKKSTNETDDAAENDEVEEPPTEDEELLTLLRYEKNTSLDNFVPVKRVYTEKELIEQEDLEKSTYQSTGVPINIIHESPVQIPKDLGVYAFNKGDTGEFPAPNSNNAGKLDYFLMDGASILPVIALDLQPSDKVLDLCSAPGGKTLVMKQTNLPESIFCNDISGSRLNRLQKVLRSYIPEDVTDDITLKQQDGRQLKNPQFNKVLVDVPCNTDRHVLLEEDNNLFKSGRTGERLQLPVVQRDLLVAGILSCIQGGSVVYSTCTLSAAQNDGIIQSALEYIWQETDVNVAVIDLNHMAKAFSKTFRFWRNSRYGQLVLPTLSCNFGPMYIAKLKVLERPVCNKNEY
ncbi:5-methylcytosine rRNA methyltransferase NSUN4-like [Mizuhopecten yessoensis]|uniref:NOL1/NOP2/Sun domain family member 4 n=1 Tax=Mizuhopecten yessoensis TaxID=6573 RepID=A0A210QAZ3_MIZYE|nr:5-methylcytosine rRNA methyltransferase NSUN4-like [Mizuhopecten yessoensis]OWF45893.1 5-methylcytosine rRNA methyltransferase NSUN4 [Mizuhopecten yessoensis]